jgi:hypothetical protein
MDPILGVYGDLAQSSFDYFPQSHATTLPLLNNDTLSCHFHFLVLHD